MGNEEKHARHLIQTMIEVPVIHSPPPDLLGTTGWQPGPASLSKLEGEKGFVAIFSYTTQYTGDITDLTPHPLTGFGLKESALTKNLTTDDKSGA